MFSHMNLIDIKMEENFDKLLQRKCDGHNKYKASYFCINPLCVKNSTSFLCELCYNNHCKSHLKHKEIKTVDEIFSTKRFNQMKEDCKIDSSHQDKINKLLQDLDHIFGKLKETLSSAIDEECKKAKTHIKQNFSINNEYVIKIFKEHEQVLLDLFTKDEVINNFTLMITPYLESLIKYQKLLGGK